MRRIGAWIGVLVLLAGVWGVWRWLGDARPVDAPRAARVEQVAPDRYAAKLAEVAEDVAPRAAATGVAERPDVQATASEGASEAPEFTCVVRVVDVLDASIEGARSGFRSGRRSKSKSRTRRDAARCAATSTRS
jgi:hypothetical protein